MKSKIILLLVAGAWNYSLAQCTFNPTVSGDTLLCPNQSGSLTTQSYDSYQWYKKAFSGSPQAIPGATSQTLIIDYFNDAGYFFSVEATDNSCTEMSPEVLVDGYVFLPPVVQTTGNFTIGPNGETIICDGDTVYFTLLQPYDTNITWFNNGIPISGATSPVLIVIDSGSYTVQAAPSICPNFVQQLGVTLDVIVINCGTGIMEQAKSAVRIYPNPAKDFIYIKNIPSDENNPEIRLFAIDRRLIMTEQINSALSEMKIDLSHIKPGIYYCTFQNEKQFVNERISIVR